MKKTTFYLLFFLPLFACHQIKYIEDTSPSYKNDPFIIKYQTAFSKSFIPRDSAIYLIKRFNRRKFKLHGALDINKISWSRFDHTLLLAVLTDPNVADIRIIMATKKEEKIDSGRVYPMVILAVTPYQKTETGMINLPEENNNLGIKGTSGKSSVKNKDQMIRKLTGVLKAQTGAPDYTKTAYFRPIALCPPPATGCDM
jgi:hypothetical protein